MKVTLTAKVIKKHGGRIMASRFPRMRRDLKSKRRHDKNTSYARGKLNRNWYFIHKTRGE